MDYKSIYRSIINRGLTGRVVDGYSENHHIIPTSMGGCNSTENKVRLTAREHYLCHWLLWKIHRNSEMAFAWMSMNRSNSRTNKGRYITSRGYESAKKSWSTMMAIENTGRVASKETRRKQSIAKVGYVPWNKGVKLGKRKSKKHFAYDKNPKKCAACGKLIPYAKRINLYCSVICCNRTENGKKDYSKRGLTSTVFKKGHSVSQEVKDKISRTMKDCNLNKHKVNGNVDN